MNVLSKLKSALKGEGSQIEEVEISVDLARELVDRLDDHHHEDLRYALDNAQGDVFTGYADEAFVIIRIARQSDC